MKAISVPASARGNHPEGRRREGHAGLLDSRLDGQGLLALVTLALFQILQGFLDLALSLGGLVERRGLALAALEAASDRTIDAFFRLGIARRTGSDPTDAADGDEGREGGQHEHHVRIHSQASAASSAFASSRSRPK